MNYKEVFDKRLNDEITNNSLYKKLSLVAFIGFLPLAITYMFREWLYSLNNIFITLLAWTIPNLSGSFIFTIAALLRLSENSLLTYGKVLIYGK